jgi:hypothetical protein
MSNRMRLIALRLWRTAKQNFTPAWPFWQLASLWYNLAAMKDTPEIGQIIRLDVTLRGSGLWLGPVWALVCGIIASGGWKWSYATALQVALLFFLVEGAWATLWAAAAETDWATPAKQWGKSDIAPAALPYTQPNTPGDRALRWYSHTVEWWREHLRPSIGRTASTIVLCIALGIALSAVLGWPVMALSAAAAAIVQLGVIIGRGTGQPLPALKATLEIGLVWLAAYVVFAPPAVTSALVAAAFAAAYGAGLTLIEGGRRATVWNAAQFAVAALLVLMRQPVAALAVFFIVIPQLLLERTVRRGTSPAFNTEATGVWFVRSTQAWLMLGMLLAAISIS